MRTGYGYDRELCMRQTWDGCSVIDLFCDGFNMWVEESFHNGLDRD